MGREGSDAGAVASEQACGRARSLVRGGVTQRYAAALTETGFETLKPRKR